jgi:hypothetical protein
MNDEKMRAEFKAWAQDQGCDTDGAWSAWQGAWNRHQSLTDAARDVLTERQRQIEREGYEPSHDDDHIDGSLAEAAAFYARNRDPRETAPRYWPWDAASWKPKTRRENLVRAGALILAEIERLDRAAGSAIAGVAIHQTNKENTHG